MYKKIHLELKNVHNVRGIVLKSIIKIRNSHFYENFDSKLVECYQFLINCLVFLGERGYFVHFSENIKCGHLKKIG